MLAQIMPIWTRGHRVNDTETPDCSFASAPPSAALKHDVAFDQVDFQAKVDVAFFALSMRRGATTASSEASHMFAVIALDGADIPETALQCAKELSHAAYREPNLRPPRRKHTMLAFWPKSYRLRLVGITTSVAHVEAVRQNDAGTSLLGYRTTRLAEASSWSGRKQTRTKLKLYACIDRFGYDALAPSVHVLLRRRAATYRTAAAHLPFQLLASLAGVAENPDVPSLFYEPKTIKSLDVPTCSIVTNAHDYIAMTYIATSAIGFALRNTRSSLAAYSVDAVSGIFFYKQSIPMLTTTNFSPLCTFLTTRLVARRSLSNCAIILCRYSHTDVALLYPNSTLFPVCEALLADAPSFFATCAPHRAPTLVRQVRSLVETAARRYRKVAVSPAAVFVPLLSEFAWRWPTLPFTARGQLVDIARPDVQATAAKTPGGVPTIHGLNAAQCSCHMCGALQAFLRTPHWSSDKNLFATCQNAARTIADL
ncbi:hypothetical protein SDRG_15595 [Saprolegnia diclina VS20]|uniref:Uncharacterized protein n=1 Tax=Saprolegnia diclina (strain VS20) TaxID=1156394 RepID=T0PZP6_SAPDV|nr:hypothetical protein SDRG_15595 [Saprolegnia diclina VS20]EQC26565.1 hypothetical protein SDRG_15595 [Saprolegnia diclina VS20]|eukprot:XP_008619995.1 hypothetical protein SDRG_15595 [Saprolegnia diclina VS20]